METKPTSKHKLKKVSEFLEFLEKANVRSAVIEHVQTVIGYSFPTFKDPEAMKDKARKDLEEARKRKAIGWIGVRSAEVTKEYQKGLGKVYAEGAFGEWESSQRIGMAKVRENQAIRDPVHEPKARAGTTNLMIGLQTGTTVDQEKLEAIFKKASERGWNMRDDRLVNAIKRIFPSDDVDERTDRSIREAVTFQDRSTNLSYRAQLSVKAKMTVEEYNVSKKPRKKNKKTTTTKKIA